MGKLYAIADLHLTYKFNLDAFTNFFSSLPSKPGAGPENNDESNDSLFLIEPEHPQDFQHGYDFTEDGLILAGDIGEKLEHLRLCFELVMKKFKTVWWVPGNHELYTLPAVQSEIGRSGSRQTEKDRDASLTHTLKGQDKYLECCRIANELGVLTPEDEFVRWQYDLVQSRPVPHPAAATVDNSGTVEHVTTMETESVLVCPIFTLYDYSFRPPHVSRENALDWAMEHDIAATDEMLLHPDPYATRDEWCEHLVRRTEERLAQAQSRGLPLVIVNHWPLREDLITIPSIPRFSLWCGTKKTEDWHTKYNAKVVVTGHLHVRRTDWRDDCRFEEVSLGYPRQWEGVRMMGMTMGDILREILPANYTGRDRGETIWRRNG